MVKLDGIEMYMYMFFYCLLIFRKMIGEVNERKEKIKKKREKEKDFYIYIYNIII